MKKPDKCLTFCNRQAWRAWLEKHHCQAKEVWLVHYKKKARKRSLTLEEGVEEALCFGWIDGLLRRLDAERFLLRYSPRRPKSIWSRTNRRRAERLVQEGRMTAAGLEKIAQAQANGEWEAAAAREDTSAVPPDLARELKKTKIGYASFVKWPPSRRKQYLHWLSTAKKSETRKKRLQTIVDLATGR